MKVISQSLKPTQTKTQKPRTVNVGLDLFGNAIPEVKSAAVDGTGKAIAMRIVKRHDMVLKPSPKRGRAATRVKKSTSKALVAVTPTLLERLAPWWVQAANKPVGHRLPPVDGVNERLEQAFKRLHHEFNEREQKLDAKMHELQQVQQTLATTKSKRQVWLWPVMLAAGAAGGYMMYIMSSMQASMINMSGNINTMNGHIGTMAADTQTMAYSTQSMNQSMYYMNNNVAYMSGNVAQMNQKVGTLAQAAAPMGEAAATVSPFMNMFKSFMPF
jgi:prefoldin subunit 5